MKLYNIFNILLIVIIAPNLCYFVHSDNETRALAMLLVLYQVMNYTYFTNLDYLISRKSKMGLVPDNVLNDCKEIPTKYNDGLYHIENDKDDTTLFCIVNVYGEPCFDEDGILLFETLEDAQHYCDDLNHCPEGALICNLI